MSKRRLSPRRLDIIRRHLTGDRYVGALSAEVDGDVSGIDQIVARMISEIDALRAERDEYRAYAAHAINLAEYMRGAFISDAAVRRSRDACLAEPTP